MIDLLTCSYAKFVSEMDQISDIDEIKEILSELEKEKNTMQKQKEANKTMTAREALKSSEGQKLIRQIPQFSELEKKIKFCNNYLLKLKIDENTFDNTSVRGSKNQKFLSEDSLKNFSWGILQMDEPEEIFERTFNYATNGRIVERKLKVINCGKFLWKDEQGLDLEKIQKDFKKTSIDLPVNSKSKNINLDDVHNALEELESHRGQLDLVSVMLTADSQDNKDIPSNYLMLMSLNRDLDWNDGEVQKFFIHTYLSKTVKEIVDNPNNERRYFGEIICDQSGKLEVSFDNDKASRAVAIANRTSGRIKTTEGVRRDTLPDMFESIKYIMNATERTRTVANNIRTKIKNLEGPIDDSDGR